MSTPVDAHPSGTNVSARRDTLRKTVRTLRSLEGMELFELETSLPPSLTVKELSAPIYHQEFYRLLQPLHPRLPDNNDPNMQLEIRMVTMENIDMDADKVKVGFVITATWQAALPEVRLEEEDEVEGPYLQYKPLPKEPDKLQKTIAQYSNKVKAYYGPGIYVKTSQSSVGPEEKLAWEDNYEKGMPNFTRVSAIELPSTSDSLEQRSVQFSSVAAFQFDLLIDGDSRRFPFDTLATKMHLTSRVITRQIKFAPISAENIKALNQDARRLSKGNYWNIREGDVTITNQFRNEYSKDVEKDDVPSQEYRSKIVLDITFRRNVSYWFWKFMFPMDIITLSGVCGFLLVPDGGPDADQQIAVTTYLVTVLLALAAFTVSLQPMLPKVSYMTVLDIHNNFCFLIIAIQAILLAVIPGSVWTRFTASSTNVITLACVIAFFIAEHLFLFFVLPKFLHSQSLKEVSADATAKIENAVMTFKAQIDDQIDDIEKVSKQAATS